MTLEGKRIVALLPMKANSQRVKNKNFRAMAGKPLFRHVLDTLLSIEMIDKIVINTDAIRVLENMGLPSNARVTLRERSHHLCGDTVSMNRVLADDVEAEPADIYIMTHTTNPLISAETICAATRKYLTATEANIADSLFTVNKIQTRFYTADGQAINHDPDNLVQTQDLTPWYEENSNLYIFSASSFSKTNARIGKRPLLYEMNKQEAVDIDEMADWEIAEALLLHRGKREGHI